MQEEEARRRQVREVAYDLQRRVKQELAFPAVIHFYCWLLQGVAYSPNDNLPPHTCMTCSSLLRIQMITCSQTGMILFGVLRIHMNSRFPPLHSDDGFETPAGGDTLGFATSRSAMPNSTGQNRNEFKTTTMQCA